MPANELTCPRCDHVLVGMMVFGAKLNRCDTCDGLWVPAAFVEALSTKPEVRARLQPLAERAAAQAPRAEATGLLAPAYCAVCREPMQRFAVATLHVTIDACRQHGTWFDKDELGRVVAFMKANPSATLKPPDAKPPKPAKSSLPKAKAKQPPPSSAPKGDSVAGDVAIGVTRGVLPLPVERSSPVLLTCYAATPPRPPASRFRR